MPIIGKPGLFKIETLNDFLGDWCTNTALPPYEEEDQEALSELGDVLVSLRDSPHYESLKLISKGLSTPLEALSIWNVIEQIAQWNATLAAREARREGETWERIGDAALISKAAALQRYDPAARKRRRERDARLKRKLAEDYPSSRTDGLSATRDDSDFMGR
jgi:hypothetical protein